MSGSRLPHGVPHHPSPQGEYLATRVQESLFHISQGSFGMRMCTAVTQPVAPSCCYPTPKPRDDQYVTEQGGGTMTGWYQYFTGYEVPTPEAPSQPYNPGGEVGRIAQLQPQYHEPLSGEPHLPGDHFYISVPHTYEPPARDAPPHASQAQTSAASCTPPYTLGYPQRLTTPPPVLATRQSRIDRDIGISAMMASPTARLFCINLFCFFLEGPASEYYTLMLETTRRLRCSEILRKFDKRFGSSTPDLTHQLNFQSATQNSGDSYDSGRTECSPWLLVHSPSSQMFIPRPYRACVMEPRTGRRVCTPWMANPRPWRKQSTACSNSDISWIFSAVVADLKRNSF